jgi:hypothetical protein
MTELPPTPWEQLADAAMARMLSWQLPLNERLIVGWLIELSYRRERESVCVPTQGHFCRLTGIDEAGVSRALKGLERAGLLQISGPRNGAKYYRLLPNGRLVEPEPIADPAAVRCALQEIEQVNALGPGYEPGGQRRMAIVTTEEQLAVEQAAASRDLAVDSTRLLRADHFAFSARSSPGILRFSQDRREQIEPATDAGAGARARNVTSNHGTNHVRDVNVGDVAEDSDSRFALESVKELIDPQEFEPWERAWKRRCQTHPRIVLEAIGDAKALSRSQKIGNWGKVIFKRCQELATAAGRTFRLFIV